MSWLSRLFGVKKKTVPNVPPLELLPPTLHGILAFMPTRETFDEAGRQMLPVVEGKCKLVVTHNFIQKERVHGMTIEGAMPKAIAVRLLKIIDQQGGDIQAVY